MTLHRSYTHQECHHRRIYYTLKVYCRLERIKATKKMLTFKALKLYEIRLYSGKHTI